jgi:hypothetical protein
MDPTDREAIACCVDTLAAEVLAAAFPACKASSISLE